MVIPPPPDGDGPRLRVGADADGQLPAARHQVGLRHAQEAELVQRVARIAGGIVGRERGRRRPQQDGRLRVRAARPHGVVVCGPAGVTEGGQPTEHSNGVRHRRRQPIPADR